MARSWLLASALLGCPTLTKAYNQSLLDCKAVAAEFRNTCAHGDYDTPAASMAAMAGATFACSPKHRCITGGTQNGNTCSWERKLCVTCRDDGGVTKIRIQTNNLPDHCVVTSSIKAKNFDYEVIFNAKETYGTWERTITTQAQLDNAVCPIVKRMDTDGNLQITEFGDAESANAMGIAVNGVAYQFANQIREDPVYPITVLNEQPLDICMGHNQLNSDSGMYHYHNLSPCLNPNFLTGKVMASCVDTADCAADITAWVTGGYTSWGTTKRVIGVSKDGHVMYGPYDSSAQLWAADNVDACNGAWSSDFQEYFYAGTQWHPYGPGCQGPANFPQQQGLYPQCSLNGMRQYDTTQTTVAPSAAPAAGPSPVPEPSPIGNPGPSPVPEPFPIGNPPSNPEPSPTLQTPGPEPAPQSQGTGPQPSPSQPSQSPAPASQSPLSVPIPAQDPAPSPQATSPGPASQNPESSPSPATQSQGSPPGPSQSPASGAPHPSPASGPVVQSPGPQSQGSPPGPSQSPGPVSTPQSPGSTPGATPAGQWPAPTPQSLAPNPGPSHTGQGPAPASYSQGPSPGPVASVQAPASLQPPSQSPQPGPQPLGSQSPQASQAEPSATPSPSDTPAPNPVNSPVSNPSGVQTSVQVLATSTAAMPAGTTGAPAAPVVTTVAPVTQGPSASPTAGTSTGPSSSGATPTPSPRPVPAVVQPSPASTPSSTASPTVAPAGSSSAPTGTATPTAAPAGSPPTTAPGSSGKTAAPTSAPTSAPTLIEPVSAAPCMRALGFSLAGTLTLL